MKNALGVGDKDKDDDEKKGGIFSFFGGDDKKEKEKDKGGPFSFGDDKKKDEEKGGFFSKIFDKDDDDEGKEKKSGFSGLFTELEGVGAAGGNEGETVGGGEGSGGFKGQSVALNDGGTYGELSAAERLTSRGHVNHDVISEAKARCSLQQNFESPRGSARCKYLPVHLLKDRLVSVLYLSIPIS